MIPPLLTTITQGGGGGGGFHGEKKLHEGSQLSGLATHKTNLGAHGSRRLGIITATN